MILALKIISCLSIALALYLIYILIDELQGNFMLSEISFPSVLISIVVFANAVLATRLIIGNTKPRKEFLILQIVHNSTDSSVYISDSF